MGLYRISSQLTEWLYAKNPQVAPKRISQIVDALEDLGSKGSGQDFNAARMIGLFHADPQRTDAKMVDTLTHQDPEADPNEVNRRVNQMYFALRGLERTGRLDKPTRNMVEKFLRESWQPLPVDEKKVELEQQVRPGVTRRPRRQNIEVQVETAPEPAAWERPEEEMIRKLDKLKAAFDERKVRLAERQFEWVKLI
jgi:hypothetical protein